MIFLSEFQVNFKRTVGLSTLKSLKTTLEMFYRDLKTDELLLSDLSKTDDICKHKLDGSENMFLIEKAAEVVHMLGNYIVDKRGITVKSRRSFDLLDRMASETRDTTLLVSDFRLD